MQAKLLLTRRRMLMATVAPAVVTAAAFLGGRTLAQAPSPERPTAILAAAKSWGYQLQKIKPTVIASAPYDVFVIDYSADGTDSLAFTAEQIARLKVKPDGGRRIVLAYLSIGEAETYRYYWQKDWETPALAPPWLGGINKRWRTNVLVRFWDDAWQKIIFRGEDTYLDRIIKAGFDGIYLDRVDVYQEFEKENADARDRMVDFVVELAEYARSRKPGFLIVPQNAEELLNDEDYRVEIDGIAKEDLLFGDGQSKRANSQKRIDDGVHYLKQMIGDHKPVFVVEYLDSPDDIAAARRQIESYGFIPHFAKRGLDVMRIGDLPPTPAPRRSQTGPDGGGGGRSGPGGGRNDPAGKNGRI